MLWLEDTAPDLFSLANWSIQSAKYFGNLNHLLLGE